MNDFRFLAILRCCAVVLLLTVLLSACGGDKRRPYTPADEQRARQEMDDSLQTDSLQAVVEEPMPTAADELFDDFFFNYAASRRLQLERTRFPLPVERDTVTTYIEKRQWKPERFFIDQDFYTLIFDSERQMDLVKDTTVARVTVERIQLSESTVQQYCFERLHGAWMLQKVCYQPLQRNPNAQFLGFYQRFVSDSLFMHQSLADQINFSGPDPDDDFQMIEGVISPEQWDAFAPTFPDGTLYNIVYDPHHPAAMQKIFVIRGIANGLEVEVTFRLQKGRWRLKKLST